MQPAEPADEAGSGGRTLAWLDEDGPAQEPAPFLPLPQPPSPQPPAPPARAPHRRAKQPKPPKPPKAPKQVKQPKHPKPPRVRPERSRRKIRLFVLVGAIMAAVVGAAAIGVATLYPVVFDGRADDPASAGSGTVSAPLDNRKDAQFDLVSGATTVNLRGADLGDDLYRITAAGGSGILPKPVHQGNQVALHLVPSGQAGTGAVDVQLSTRVPWRLRLTGGAKAHVVDMRAGRLAGVEVLGGATKVELSLPKPDGTVPVKVTGGVDQLIMHAPAGVLARVRLGAGASSVALDKFGRADVEAGTVFTPDGWAAGKSRYDIDAVAGVSTLRLDRTQ